MPRFKKADFFFSIVCNISDSMLSAFMESQLAIIRISFQAGYSPLSSDTGTGGPTESGILAEDRAGSRREHIF